jgi:preprotein translocase subunit SecG
MMSARGTANLLTRLTAVLATLFMGANLLLAYLAKVEVNQAKVTLEDVSRTPAPSPSTNP